MDKRTKNLTAIGLLTILTTVLFFYMMYWLLGSPLLRSQTQLTVALDDGGGLKRSDPVQLQGVEVGSVSAVRLNPAGGVIVELSVSDELSLPTDTKAVVRGDVFGAHIVDLVPGTSVVKLGAGDTIRGGTTTQLTQLASDLSARVDSVLINAGSLLSPAAVRDIHATAAELPASARELRAAFAEFRVAATALRRTTENFESANTGAAIQSTLGELEKSARALTVAAGRMDQSLTSFASVMNKIDSGQGTLGRLINDPSTLDELNNTLREFRALATDIRERPNRYLTVKVF